MNRTVAPCTLTIAFVVNLNCTLKPVLKPLEFALQFNV